MKLSDVNIPEIYHESADFRFFVKLFETCITKIQYDIDNLVDLYDPLRCPESLLWLLADTMGYKMDDRFPTSYCRLILLNFMKLIKYRGSVTGVSLAAALNVSQFNIINYGKEKPILNNRLEDTSVPVNACYVKSHPEDGYIDLVYYSTEMPTDACLEYVRPLGMYVFPHIGVSYQSRTKLGIDVRLTNLTDMGTEAGITRVGNYSYDDYSSMQKMFNDPRDIIDPDHTRKPVWNRNSKAEGEPKAYPDPGFRSLYSLQLCNSKHQVDALLQVPKDHQPIDELTSEDVVIVEPRPYVRRARSRVDRNNNKNVTQVSANASQVIKNKPKKLKKKSQEPKVFGQLDSAMWTSETDNTTLDADSMVQINKKSKPVSAIKSNIETSKSGKIIESRRKQMRERRNQ